LEQGTELAIVYDQFGNASLYNSQRIVLEFSSKYSEDMGTVAYVLTENEIEYRVEFNRTTERFRIRISKLDDVFYILSTICGNAKELSKEKAEKAKLALSLVKFMYVSRNDLRVQ